MFGAVQSLSAPIIRRLKSRIIIFFRHPALPRRQQASGLTPTRFVVLPRWRSANRHRNMSAGKSRLGRCVMPERSARLLAASATSLFALPPRQPTCARLISNAMTLIDEFPERRQLDIGIAADGWSCRRIRESQAAAAILASQVPASEGENKRPACSQREYLSCQPIGLESIRRNKTIARCD